MIKFVLCVLYHLVYMRIMFCHLQIHFAMNVCIFFSHCLPSAQSKSAIFEKSILATILSKICLALPFIVLSTRVFFKPRP